MQAGTFTCHLLVDVNTTLRSRMSSEHRSSNPLSHQQGSCSIPVMPSQEGLAGSTQPHLEMENPWQA